MAKKTSNNDSGRLFVEPTGQRRIFDKSLQEELEDQKAAGIVCCGEAFSDLSTLCAHFRDLLKARLQDGQLRETPGFPDATDDAILAMSEPPYYTCCPNPFVPALVKEFAASRSTPGEDYHPRLRLPRM